MRLPHLFCQLHGSAIFSIWVRNDQSLFVKVIPQEPLGAVVTMPDDKAMPDSTVTVVTVRCWNDRGIMRFGAASPADLKAAQEWADRHRDTPPESFQWVPRHNASSAPNPA
jgi:hypothetical protein